MRRMFLFTGLALVFLPMISALALRMREAPYIAYERGDYESARSGLAIKAEERHGFAAYLLATMHQYGQGGPIDLRTAVGWYVKAAQLGELRAVGSYIAAVIGELKEPVACRKAVSLLELTARTGDLGSLITLARVYRHGICVERDLPRAAESLMAGTRVDGRIANNRDAFLKTLSADQIAQVRSVSERFDVDPREALALFLTEAPALLPQSLR